MHHKNNRYSTANHNNPQQHKQNNNLPVGPAPGGSSTQRKSNLLKSIAGRFREKPATEEEVKQLRLNTVREELKTRKQIARTRRPSRFSGFGGGESRQPSYRRSSRYNQEGSGLFGGGGKKSGGGFLDFDSGPSLSMFGGGQQKKGKNQKSGLEELF